MLDHMSLRIYGSKIRGAVTKTIKVLKEAHRLFIFLFLASKLGMTFKKAI